MKLLKMGQIVPKQTPNTFEVDITVMHGDADSFDHFVIGPFKEDGTDDEAIEDLLLTLNRMKDAFPNGRGGGVRDNYDNVPGFTEWFAGEAMEGPPWGWISEPKFWQYTKDIDNEQWPVDQYDYETHGDPYQVNVYYYDENLNKFAVQVAL